MSNQTTPAPLNQNPLAHYSTQNLRSRMLLYGYLERYAISLELISRGALGVFDRPKNPMRFKSVADLRAMLKDCDVGGSHWWAITQEIKTRHRGCFRELNSYASRLLRYEVYPLN